MQDKSKKQGPSLSKLLVHQLLNTRNSSGQKPLPPKVEAKIKRGIK